MQTRGILVSFLVAASALAATLAACSGNDEVAAASDVASDVAVQADLGGPEAVGSVDVASPPVDVGAGPELVAFDGQTGGEGELGAPCFSNNDCHSGYCIEGPDGLLCTKTCVDDCPDGYACKSVASTAPDIVFICVPNVLELCAPCGADAHCFGGLCVDDGTQDAAFCTAHCSADLACPDGFECQMDLADSLGQRTVNACVSTSGTCGCTANSAGRVRPCSRSNEHGACAGFETCEAGGWGACNAPTPAAEACDYQDNDCDGDVDEGFLDESGRYASYGHCGVCGATCEGAIANALIMCDGETYDPPQCAVVECTAGFYQLNPFYCGSVPAGLCAACETDANCVVAGAQCTDLGDGSFCTVPCETSDACPGGYECLDPGNGDLQCVPSSGTCQCEAGSVGLQRACEATYQNPQEPTAPLVTCVGLETCSEAGWSPCALGADICDYADNDCDGVVDNAWVNEDGLYTRDENCGVCGNNCTADTPPANAINVCDSSGPVPQCGIACVEGTVDVNGNPADGCECERDEGVDRPDGVDHDCDGVDGELAVAVFVAKNGDDSNPGTIAAPVRSIQAGIDLAQSEGKRDVYVATGVYAESIALAAGVTTYGGFNGDFSARDLTLYETAILGDDPSAEKPGAVNAIGLGGDPGTTGLVGFTVFGGTTKVAGSSSYAVYVADSGDALTVRDNVIFAGSGGDGADGSGGDSGDIGNPGDPGLVAVDVGSAQCTAADVRAGGVGGALTCGSQGVGGGVGGTSVCPDYNESKGEDACPVSSDQAATAVEAGASGAGGAGGAGGAAGGDAYLNALDGPFSSCEAHGANCTICKIPANQSKDGAPGQAGAIGPPGDAGAACPADGGSVVNGLWQPAGGGLGQDGAPGHGGGGGGAGGGVETWGCSDDVGGFHDLGGSGGGGGSGGCGGTGGQPGSGGGGSFAVFVTYSAGAAGLPEITSNTIVRADGGDGGDGGTGGTGGAGGSGGGAGASAAGDTDTFCSASGGPGGDGGSGGSGGGGGGGCGGVSFGIYVTEGTGPAAWQSENTFAADGSGGQGGQGGLSLGQPGEDGGAGASGDTNF